MFETEYKQKYVVKEGRWPRRATHWYYECTDNEIPFIQVEKNETGFGVVWVFGYLPSQLHNIMKEMTPSLNLSIKNLIQAEFGSVVGRTGTCNGEFFGLTRYRATEIAVVLAEYLFNLVKLAKQKLVSDAG